MEGSLTVNGSAIDIELKNRALEKANEVLKLQSLPPTNGEVEDSEGPALLVRSRQERSTGTFEIEEGMPDNVATEAKTALEAADYKITISQPTPSPAA